MASGGSSFFDRGPGGVSPKLSPAAAEAVKKGRELEAAGITYDENLSDCGPPGFPRWLIIPFLREFIVRPEQTWLSSETVNNVRRIYTDGRGHPPPEDRYPLYYGDSLGFWDGQKLVIHTNQLMKRSMGRNQPEQSEQMETVEIWEKIDRRTIEAKVWIYDPAVYLEPWYLTRRYMQVDNPDKRSEEHTSELQSRENLVCRLLLEKKKKTDLMIVAGTLTYKMTMRTKLIYATMTEPKHITSLASC